MGFSKYVSQCRATLIPQIHFGEDMLQAQNREYYKGANLLKKVWFDFGKVTMNIPVEPDNF